MSRIISRLHLIAASAVFTGILLFMSQVLGSCGYKSGAAVILAGSTSVQPFAEILAEQYMNQNPGITIDVQGGGSSAGIMAAESGTADIGMSSRDLTEEEKQALLFIEIARDGLAIIVHPSNPVANLSLEQVRGIYSDKITDWSTVGGEKSRIHVVVREEGSGTRGAFEGQVMGGVEITPKAIVQDSNGAVRQVVADDPDAIGFISLGLVSEKVKALELDQVEATRENVLNGTYTLSRPFLFLTRTEPVGQSKSFIDFTLSAEGKRLLSNEGLITMNAGTTN